MSGVSANRDNDEIIPDNGVRISCDIIAKNLDFTSIATSNSLVLDLNQLLVIGNFQKS